MTTPHDLEIALQLTRDRNSFLKNLLIDALEWPIPDHVDSPEEISYAWSAADLRTQGLEKQLVAGEVWQIQALQANQPWAIFLLEFTNPEAFISGRGLTGPLRKVLRGLVPSRRQHSNLATWKRENLLFICTHAYQHFRLAYFKAPLENSKAAPLAAFGWGPDMPARTACEFNLPALEWPEPGTSDADWTAAWATAFDVEKVTKKFYEEYAKAFASIEKSIAKENGLADDEDLRMFTQTFVNRLMFLRFLERKGWLKFGGDENYLRTLFGAGPHGKKSFYRGRLVPLFFEGLATEKHDTSPVYGDVPFLNGGLFEENDLDRRIKEVPADALGKLIGPDGLFYRFNFTVEESTPLDIEVAVDPEMLGKVFEELVTGRHESGSYYTPRPVVSFMCREALKGYLAGKTKAKPEAIAALIDRADVSGLNVTHGRQILAALDSLKAVDPACGSGAYLLGLLHELVAIYRLLTSESLVKDPRSVYDLKLNIISNNLYGVDIDPFATNIAMLRLWLSLEVEADTPLPLPNLDFKIESGDSLVGPDPRAELSSLQDHAAYAKADVLVRLKDQYMQSHGAMRAKYRDNIEATEREIEELLKETHGEGVVNWRVQFAEVFLCQNGFDVVLANPPYIRQELIKAIKPALKNVYQHLYSGTADLYVFFYLRGLQLLAPGGMLVFISSNKWFRAGYGEKLRAHIAKTTTVQTIVDFHDLPVFEAIAYPMIFIAKKQSPTDHHTAILAEPPDLEPPYPDVKEVVAKYGFAMPKAALGQDGTWHLAEAKAADHLSKMRSSGPTLGEFVGGRMYRGVLTGLNEAWVDGNGRIYVKGEKRPRDAERAGVFLINGDERKELISQDKNSAKIIKPLVQGKDIKRWAVERRDLWLVFTRRGIDIEEFPAVRDHLKRFRHELTPRKRDDHADKPGRKPGSYKWYEVQDEIAYFAEFDGPKIILPDISPEPRFALAEPGVFSNDTTFIIPGDDRYLLAVLNSKPVGDYYLEVSAQVRGGYTRYKRIYFETIPIPTASAADRSAIAALAQKCLDARGVGCEVWEKEIDERVAALYGLDVADLGDKSSRPAPIYDTKGRLVHRVIPKLAMATPGFPYFSLDAIKAELEKHRGGVKPESLNHYMHELTGEGVVYDAGRGWYSTLSEPLVLDREPVRELVKTLEKRFPFLEFSCWSTKQVAAYGHHQLARFTSFVYTERDAMESVADALREAGQTAFVDPGKALIGKSVKLSDGAIVVRPLVTRAPVDGHYALAEKVLVDLFKESEDLKLMDTAEFGRILVNSISSYRISVSAILAYAERRNAALLQFAESINAK